MMNPYILLAVAIASFGAGWTVDSWRRDSVEVAVKQAYEDSMIGTAAQIANIEVKNTTIQNKVREITIEKPVYKNCVHDADSVHLINAALEPPSDSKLPAANTTRTR